MNRRSFIIDSTAAIALATAKMGTRSTDGAPSQALPHGVDESLEGKTVNLARFGELQSWINPEATPYLQKALPYGHSNGTPLRLAALPSKTSEFDVGFEWPEFRAINKVVARFASTESAPSVSTLFLESWDGITALQGRWREIDNMYWGFPLQGLPLEINGATWVFPFATRKTCKARIRLQNSKQVEIKNLEVYGPSICKQGKVHIEWGHSPDKNLYDGQLEIYNGEILELRPFGTTQMEGPVSWLSRTTGRDIGGISVKLLFTEGEIVDRTVLTVRTKSGSFSFLPAEALEGDPIDIPDFGAFIRNDEVLVERAEYRRRNSGKSRIIDAVAKLPEQTLANAHEHIRVPRVPLCFVGVDSNNQKFGIAPDGHLVIGSNDPSHGRPIAPSFAFYCESAEASTFFQEPLFKPGDLFKQVEEKHQELEEGWLPIVTTSWSRNDVSFERTDFAALYAASEPIDQSKLKGNELAFLVSRLRIRNGSPVPKTASYLVKPWKPQAGDLGFGPIPANTPSAWQVMLDGAVVTVLEGGTHYALAYVDAQGSGKISQEPQLGAIRYSVKIDPGEQHIIHIVVSGQPLPREEGTKLQNVPYDRLHEATVRYWKDRLAEGMQIQIPDSHLQNIYHASLHHFLLAMTKDATRGESYPNTATFMYGTIGSESSPIVQALDMRGVHKRSEECLQGWLSTQGDSMPDGDYATKEGGFFHFWPIYTVGQGGVLWALAEHYLYTKDSSWLRKAAPQIIAGCDFIIRERKRTMKALPSGQRPIWYGLAPAGCVFDMRDWEYTFMLNGWFYVGMKKSAKVLMDLDAENAKRIASEAEDYRQAILTALRDTIALSPVTRLRDNTSVPSVPPFPGLRGFRTELKDIPDVGYGQGYIYDVEGGPLHLLKAEVLDPNAIEASWMLTYLEDRFFTYSPGQCRIRLDDLSQDWFNLGGFAKLQPYYLHYQDAYLQRDQIANFLRGFFNTLAATADPQTLTFNESIASDAGQPNKTHEEGWFFHQFRFMLVMEVGDDLFLAKGTPRQWLEDGKTISVSKAPSYFGELAYRIESFANQARIEANVQPPNRSRPANLYLRLRHPKGLPLKRVTINGRAWKGFDAEKEWIKMPVQEGELRTIAYYS